MTGRFVVIGHIAPALVCLIPTTNTDRYDNDETRRAGAVCFEAGEVDCFERKTVIEPIEKNRLALPYNTVIRANNNSAFRELRPLPQDFHHKLIVAVENNPTLNAVARARWRKFLEDNHRA